MRENKDKCLENIGYLTYQQNVMYLARIGQITYSFKFDNSSSW